jgi:uncharacterized protein YndB with AHSA1/START domain
MSAVRREIVLPVPPGRVWEAITSPEALREWFGAEVWWELRPGAAGRVQEDDGSTRWARVGTVEPGRHLGFRWWPEGHEDEASDVDYELSEEGEGTRLVVTESPASPVDATALAGPSARATHRLSSESWTDGDTRTFRVWAAAAPTAAITSRV